MKKVVTKSFDIQWAPKWLNAITLNGKYIYTLTYISQY